MNQGSKEGHSVELNLFCVILTINKTALSNCSAILSAIFSAHGVGLLVEMMARLKKRLEKFTFCNNQNCCVFNILNIYTAYNNNSKNGEMSI